MTSSSPSNLRAGPTTDSLATPDKPSIGLGPSLSAERLTALATPAARLLLVASVVMSAISAVANLSAVQDISTDEAIRLAMHSSTVATLIFSVLAGLYSATTDHRFGIVDQRLLGQPRRGVVLAAKAMTTAILGLLYGMLGAATAVLAAGGFYWAKGVSFDPTSPLVIRALVGVVLAAPMFAVIGVAVGTIVRNQPIAIGGTLAWLLIIEPTAIVGLPSIGGWLPGAAGLALTYGPDPALLSQVTGGAVLAGYTTVAYHLATHFFARADI